MRNQLLQFNSKQISIALISVLIIFSGDAFAGGPWVMQPGQANLSFGFSRKVGKQRWSPTVDTKDTPTDYSDDVITYSLQTPPDSTTVDGKFHVFRYYYFQGYLGICKNLELDWTINYLVGREAQTANPYTGQKWTYMDANGNPIIGADGTYHYAVWEKNSGFTDSWLGLKYQFIHGPWPVAVELTSRFPDLYDEPGDVYTRNKWYFNNNLGTSSPLVQYTAVNGNTSSTVKDTVIEPGSEWRGLLKRDFGLTFHTGHSFLSNYALYVQAFAGYNIRQGAYADQLLFGINGGYSWKVSDHVILLPSLWLDYVGGIGNGGQPDLSDRFFSVYKNYNFNNSKHLRAYINAEVIFNEQLDVKAGYGNWLWGVGEVKYNEMFIQLSYLFGANKKS